MEISQNKHEILIKMKPTGVDDPLVFVDRRVGIAWPGAHNPAYFCMFGLERLPGAAGERPLRLLCEFENTKDGAQGTNARFFQALAFMCRKLHCKWCFCDLQTPAVNMERAFDLFVRDRGVRNIRLENSYEYSGIVEAGPRIRELNSKKLLLLKTPLVYFTGQERGVSLLRRQIGTADPVGVAGTVDRVRPEERYHALYALSHVVTSYQQRPWRIPQKLDVPGPTEGYR